jgi:hypothetical protein
MEKALRSKSVIDQLACGHACLGAQGHRIFALHEEVMP